MSQLKIVRILPIILILVSCIRSDDWEVTSSTCNSNLKANTTIQNVYDMYQGNTVKILEDLVLEGYVISSD